MIIAHVLEHNTPNVNQFYPRRKKWNKSIEFLCIFSHGFARLNAYTLLRRLVQWLHTIRSCGIIGTFFPSLQDLGQTNSVTISWLLYSVLTSLSCSSGFNLSFEWTGRDCLTLLTRTQPLNYEWQSHICANGDKVTTNHKKNMRLYFSLFFEALYNQLFLLQAILPNSLKSS